MSKTNFTEPDIKRAVKGVIDGGGGYGTDRRLSALASVAAKLTRAYCTQVETYRRLRGGGDQNIRVEHVHVHDGGQAIVGTINRSSEQK